MKIHKVTFILFLFVFLLIQQTSCIQAQDDRIRVGAEQIEKYFPLLKNKKIGLVVNHTALLGNTHLVDTLLSLGIDIKGVFAPEHGFRGTADAGAHIKDEIDQKTALPIYSLYGNNRKPDPNLIRQFDLILFDIQDVGARFYTYISTMTYVMEACAGAGVPLLILDRPNPNGHYVSGPVLENQYSSFIGLHEIPIVHGMTIAEYAQMVNGESWIDGFCELYFITCENYHHQKPYQLPIAPSPNLPNMKSIYLYPSLCLFEATEVSVGRGTDKQFQLIGMPGYVHGDTGFTPKAMPGAQNPKHKGVYCMGNDLSQISEEQLYTMRKVDLSWLIKLYQKAPDKSKFFHTHFKKLAGTETLQKQIEDGWTQERIESSWETGINQFLKMRKPYLLYPE